ncbi:MAG: tetratricopeptide repeat protein [Myxococcota bacterium]
MAIGVLSFFTTVVSGALLHVLNQKRLGREKPQWWLVAGAVVVQGLLMGSVFVVPEDSALDRALTPASGGLGIAFAIWLAKGPHRALFERYRDLGGEVATAWGAFGIASAVATVVVGPFVGVVIAEEVRISELNDGFAEGQRAFDEERYEDARRLFNASCEGGAPGACTNEGWLYENGLGGRANPQRARRLYDEGCEGGDPTGCNNLGVMIEQGVGGRTNPDLARELFRRACAGGDDYGCNNADRLDGFGGVQDYLAPPY